MRLDDLYLWFLGDPATPRYVGALKLVSAGKGVSLHYAKAWLDSGFALSEDLPLVDTQFLPPGRLSTDSQRAVGAVDDARPDRWGEKVIRFVDKPRRLSLMEYLYYARRPLRCSRRVHLTGQLQPVQAGVAARDIESLAERIDGAELLAQRSGFDPTGFQPAPARKPRRSPFRRV